MLVVSVGLRVMVHRTVRNASLLQNGWGVCGAEQALYHQPTNTKIPIDLQNQSMTIQGWIKAIGSLDDDNEAPQFLRSEPSRVRFLVAWTRAPLAGSGHGAVSPHVS